MLETFFKKAFCATLVDWVVLFLQRWPRLKPYHITFLALSTGVIGALLIALGVKWVALTMIIFSGYLDVLDGPFARATGQVSNSGCVCDIVSDRVVEAAIIIGFYVRFGHGILSLFMLSATLICVTSFLVVSMFLERDGEMSFTYSPGIIQRAEAFCFFSAMLIFEKWQAQFGWLFVILVCLTVVVRLRQFIKKEEFVCTEID